MPRFTVNERPLEIVFTTLEPDKGEHDPEDEVFLVETTHRLPARYVVCGQCNGRGTSSSHLGAWTGEEWEQESREFQEDYINGVYDRPCPACGGKRVVAVPYQMREYFKEEDRQTLKLYQRLQQEEREYEAMCAAERRMGA
jgi:hypothetical protein